MILGAAASFAVGTILLIASVSAVSSTGAPEGVPEVATSSSEENATAEPSSAPAPLSQKEGSPQSLVDQTWVQEYAEITGIPARALSAYAAASLHVGSEFPDCALGWNTLAGIGYVESHHGTIYGSSLDHDGVASPAIIGIPLTGETTQAIRDTDHGELDGDTVWDRAVGPMQFIPTTWAEWGTDGNGDGKADPQNIDDSALSAARYLCSVGGDLNDPDRWIAAVHAYNPTVEYNNLVAEAAEQYGSVG
ncbi:MAG TPA: lytic murein transglycosylase [Microbacterium sp.]|nr:lytic murein transglycosylase [Microbacterium sp.]